MKPLVDEVCPWASDNKVCAWCFYIGIGVTSHDIIVSCIISSIIAHNKVSPCIYVYSTVVGCGHVAIDAVSPAGDVDARTIAASRAVPLAGVTLNGTKIID